MKADSPYETNGLIGNSPSQNSTIVTFKDITQGYMIYYITYGRGGYVSVHGDNRTFSIAPDTDNKVVISYENGYLRPGYEYTAVYPSI